MSNIALPLILAFALLVGGSAAVSAAGALVGSVNAAFDVTRTEAVGAANSP